MMEKCKELEFPEGRGGLESASRILMKGSGIRFADSDDRMVPPMKTLLVTGGSGLVGSAIQNIITPADRGIYNIIFIKSSDYDLTDTLQVKNLFEKYNPQLVIHLAAYVGGLYKNMNHKVEMLEKNILMNFNIVRACHEFNVEKLIACLSTCIFPDKTTYPINEDMLHNGPPHHSNDAYAYAKRLLEIQCNTYRENYGDNFVCIIPTNIYGPSDNFSLEDGHVIPSLIHKCYIAKKEKKQFIVRGSGTPLRQFIYSEDLAKLILWTLENIDDRSIILSVSEKDEVTIGHVAKLIAKEFDYQENMYFDTSFSDGQYKKTADNSKLMNRLGDSTFEFTNMEAGIRNSVQWFIENYDNARK
jgi:GDP-L-fucose synthase